MTLDSAIGVINSASHNGEIDQYLQAVDEIQRSIASGTADDQRRAKSAIQTAMPFLADEMRHLLKVNVESTNNPDSTTYSSTMTDSGSNSYVDDYEHRSTLSAEVINHLRSIVNRMNGAGYLIHSKEAYVSERKCCIDASYQKLGVQKLSIENARKMDWNELELPIKVWIKSAKICFRKIFAYEKQLCEQIFGDLGDECFLQISNERAFELLEISANLSHIKTASDRLFGILGLYKTVFELIPEINKLFDTQSSESIRVKADQTVDKLAGAACMIVEKFEKDLLIADMRSEAKLAVPVDKIHSLCRYVMDYVVKLDQHKQILMKLSLSNPPLISGRHSGGGMNYTSVEPQLQCKLPFHVMWIVICLVSKLEREAKLYKNACDGNFYLMNNLFYIVKKIDGKAEVKEMIGEECVEKVSLKFDQAKAEYLRLTLAKVLIVLGDNKMSLRKRIKGFNDEFKKLQTNLGNLRVPDFQLLKDIRASMEEMLVKAYASFLEQLSTSHCSTADVKFSVEELKSAILGFFPNT